MKWIGTSWKMNNNIIQTHRYIDTLLRNKKYLKYSNYNNGKMTLIVLKSSLKKQLISSLKIEFS